MACGQITRCYYRLSAAVMRVGGGRKLCGMKLVDKAGIPASIYLHTPDMKPITFGQRLKLLLMLPLALVTLSSCGGSDDEIPDQVQGDIQQSVSVANLDQMPVQAEGFLATDRPWRAAINMRRFIEASSEVGDDHRVLAARAEAGWGAWPEARALLEDVPALDTYQRGIGVYLLARALEETGDANGAAELYREFLALSPPAGELEAERAAARLRLGLALLKSGETAAGREELTASSDAAGGASYWFGLLEADALAQSGDTAGVEEAVEGFDSGYRGLRGWRARIEAAWQTGNQAAVRRVANQARAWASSDATRAEFLVQAGRAAVEMGDISAGRGAFRSAISLGAGGVAAQAAADELVAGDMSPADHLSVARVNRALGLHEEAAEGFRTWLDSDVGSESERENVHLSHATALFYAERYRNVEDALRPVEDQLDARMLRARTEEHLGNVDESVRIYLEIAQEYEGSGNGALALLLAADARHAAGDFERAREIFLRLVSRYPGSTEMGIAMMRLAGIAFYEEEYDAAAEIWDEYRARYPRGASALQATYWSGRAREEMGNASEATALYRSVMQRDRDSYYALLASERLDEPFWPLPMNDAPPADRAADSRVAAWMRGIDFLREAGFPDEASAEVDRIVPSAGNDRATLYALAEALAERGYSQRAIRIGQRLGGSGQPDRRLLRILFPFPYRNLVVEEATERGLEPFVTAALIRQESMFEARITSHVGARGLMQIMPATGRRLAEAADIGSWDPELLYHPEINVHLGTRYVAQHWNNYDGSLPSVFSAYNAGAHRVDRWSEYPEYGLEELFTERIPFAETRNYVKILTRNRAIYSGLYGGDDGGNPSSEAR